MTPEELKALMDGLAALRGVVSDGIGDLSKRCDALSEDFAKLKADTAGHRSRPGDQMRSDDGDDDPTMAERTAADRAERRADSIAADMRNLQNRVNAMAIHTNMNQGTRDQFADLQAKADVAYRGWNESAPPPMSGEGVLDYAIRLHRPLQRHSKKFKTTELLALARDPTTLATICDQIRADTVEASMSPVDMPMFQHRMIEEVMPTGHISRRFVGNGTIFKQLGRPGRYVAGFHVQNNIGRPGVAGSAGGTILASH
jgi:hypothetical protein